VTLISVGSSYNRTARYSEGLQFQEAGLKIAEELGNLHHQAATHHNIAFALRNLYRFDEASEHSERALALYAELGDELNYGRALESRVVAHVAHGRFEEAYEVIQEGLATTRRFGDLKFEGNYLDQLGTVLLCLGRPEEARQSWRRAADLLAEDEAGWAGVLLTWLADLDGLDDDPRVGVRSPEESEAS
jgi:tetratricopeptide (TPR) repeat protein